MLQLASLATCAHRFTTMSMALLSFSLRWCELTNGSTMTTSTFMALMWCVSASAAGVSTLAPPACSAMISGSSRPLLTSSLSPRSSCVMLWCWAMPAIRRWSSSNGSSRFHTHTRRGSVSTPMIERPVAIATASASVIAVLPVPPGATVTDRNFLM